MTGGEAVAGALERAGVDLAFTVPGESFLGLLDALYVSPIRLVATRHEGAAAFAAEAYGQLTGRPAACLATRAVGAANLAIGLHTARQDSTPLIALVGQVPRAFRGREAFQEVDQVETFGRLCKEAIEIDDPERLAPEIERLVAICRAGRPGPVFASLPEDVLDAHVAPGTTHGAAPPAPEAGALTPDPPVVATVMERLAAARRPLILAGGGILRSGATAALVRFAEAWQCPVISAWRRPDAFPNEHELYLGMTGYGAPARVRERFAEADAVLVLGSRLSEITTFGYELPSAGTVLIRVDLEPGLPGADRAQPQVRVRADVAAFLEAAIAHQPPAHTAERQRANAADRAAYEAATEPPAAPMGRPVHPVAAVHALRSLLRADAIVTTDAGNFGGWAARYLPIRSGMRFLGPTSGAMGYGLPAAIAAALAEPGRSVVALAGDGGFAMLMGELETAVREGLHHLTAIVFDNRQYGTIRMHQELAHPGRVVATELGPIDFAAVARACGASAWSVEEDAGVEPALQAALATEGVSVVHLRTDPAVLSVDLQLGPARDGAARTIGA